MMLPSAIFLGAEVIPADLALSILEGALGEEPLATRRDQPFGRGIRWSVQERVRTIAIRFAANDQPLGTWLLTLSDRPDTLHGEIGFQEPTFEMAYLYPLPLAVATTSQRAHFMDDVWAEYPWSRGGATRLWRISGTPTRGLLR